MNTKSHIQKLVYAAVCLALAMVLPLLTGQIPEVGNMLCPMHIPALLCGFLCGWPWGLAVGFLSPLLRFAIFSMPPLYPVGVAMAFELAVYGAVSGLLYGRLPKTTGSIYCALIAAMVAGRMIWGLVHVILAGLSGTQFPMAAFISGAVTTAIPGIILQLVLIPAIIVAMKKAKLVLND